MCKQHPFLIILSNFHDTQTHTHKFAGCILNRLTLMPQATIGYTVYVYINTAFTPNTPLIGSSSPNLQGLGGYVQGMRMLYKYFSAFIYV